jgi:hypothetical protein
VKTVLNWQAKQRKTNIEFIPGSLVPANQQFLTQKKGNIKLKNQNQPRFLRYLIIADVVETNLQIKAVAPVV